MRSDSLPEKTIKHLEVQGMNVLHCACFRSNSDALDWLLNVCLTKDEILKLLRQRAHLENETPLMIACKLGHLDCVKQILTYLKSNNCLLPDVLNVQN